MESLVIGCFLSLFLDQVAEESKRLYRKRKDEKTTARRKAYESLHTYRQDIGEACVEWGRHIHTLGLGALEHPLLSLLNDDGFQDNLAKWFIGDSTDERDRLQEDLLVRIRDMLQTLGMDAQVIQQQTEGLFDRLNRALVGDPSLAHWQQGLIGLKTLKNTETLLGQFTEQQKSDAIASYIEGLLRTCEVISLEYLPNESVQDATSRLLLRQLYMPLTIRMEQKIEKGKEKVSEFEMMRNRRHQAGSHRLMRDEDRTEENSRQPFPIGTCLNSNRRLVILGDPGGGKSTLLRWLASAYALHWQGSNGYAQLPDTDTLPDEKWLPILIRCRDLSPEVLGESLEKILEQHFEKTAKGVSHILASACREYLEQGRALLLVDGLDEISDISVRWRFSEELDRTAEHYRYVPIVITSRIVGYRTMPHRMASDFAHGMIAELDQATKEQFAHHWIQVTASHKLQNEQEQDIDELCEALNANSRIQRLTDNPMLLTTLALIKRKVGRLPSRRVKLYEEAVKVLLNWNPKCHAILEEDEALPQLRCIAYAMCDKGVQQLHENEILDILDKFRANSPNLRGIRKKSTEEFLKCLEERSGLLIHVGDIWTKNSDHKKIMEFRHLTFQEYLAASALCKGQYLGYDPDLEPALHDLVVPLVRYIVEEQGAMGNLDPMSSGPWHEVIRLAVADCEPREINKVLNAVSSSFEGESDEVLCARAIFAAFCLADASDGVSSEIAYKIVVAFADEFNKCPFPFRSSLLCRAAEELVDGQSFEHIDSTLASRFINNKKIMKIFEEVAFDEMKKIKNIGMLLQKLNNQYGYVRSAACFALGELKDVYALDSLIEMLKDSDWLVRHAACSSLGKLKDARAVNPLIGMLRDKDLDVRLAACWSLRDLKNIDAVEPLIDILEDEAWRVRRASCFALGNINNARVVEALIKKLGDIDWRVKEGACNVLGTLNDVQAVSPLIKMLDDESERVRGAACEALGELKDTRAVKPLIGKLGDKNAAVRSAVCDVLCELNDALIVVALLIEKLGDDDKVVREMACRILGKLGHAYALKPLLGMLVDRDANVRSAACSALGWLEDACAVNSLIGMLDDENGYVRCAACSALGRLNDTCALDPLLVMLGDSDEDVRRAACFALGDLKDGRAVKPLTKMLADDNEYVWEAAREALDELEKAEASK